MGVFICFAEQVTSGMLKTAKQQGKFYKHFDYDKIQIISVEDLLAGKNIAMPESDAVTFRQK